MSFFGRSVLSPSALRAHYLALVAVHHPDRGGDEAVMKSINVEYSALKTATASPKPPVYRPQAPNPGPQWDGGCPEDDAPRRPSNPPVTHPRSKFKPKLPTRAHPRYVEIRKAWDEAYEESLHEATSLKAFLCADNNCEACWKYFSCPP